MFSHRSPGQRSRALLATMMTMVAVLVGSNVLGSPHALAVSTTVVISEFRTRGPNGASDEFVELYNASSSAVNIGGWKINGSNNAASISTRVTIAAGVVLNPGCRFLATNNSTSGGPYSGGVAGDQTFATGITDDGGIALLQANNTIVDAVGMSTGSAYKEGTTLAKMTATTNQSYERKPGGGTDNSQDTDNNASDFLLNASSSNPQNRASTCTPKGPPTPTNTPLPTNTPTPIPGTHIHDIQGAAHISPLQSQVVSNVTGIVTAKTTSGFFMQDPSPDTNPATSEGIFVFTSSAPTVSVGDLVRVGGTVSEFRPGGATGTTNLTTTEISSPSITILSSGNALPAATIIGNGGRIPPAAIIDNDATGDVETSGTFDATTDGIDFYESLEGMLVQVNNALVVGPTTTNGEIAVVGDNGVNASIRTPRGGVIIGDAYGDFNPERIILDDVIASTEPALNVGDRFATAITGVMDYSFGNFKLEVLAWPTTISGGLTQEIASAPIAGQISVATFNVENLDIGDGTAKFNTLASLIVTNLRAPDLIAVEEIQDNNGPTNDAVVDATTTYNTLISAIQTAGGPTYQYRQINPVDDQDGGEPGGNIRQGFLFRTDRGLSFIDRAPPGGTNLSTTGTSVVSVGGVPQLAFSPGRISPTDAAFSASRKPLVGEFSFNGVKFFAIANHFNSKGGDQPLFGHFQQPTRSSETQRGQQATIVRNFVSSILAIDPSAKVIVLGDLNDFEFSPTVTTLKGGGLNALIETLPKNERYSYVYEGNSQAIDHILASSGLSTKLAYYDVVHVNSEFASPISDHEPQVAHFTLP